MTGYDLQVARQWLKQWALMKAFKQKFHCGTKAASSF